LGGALLCQILTQSTVKVRILGKSEAPELPTGALVTATGNNLVLIGDLTRRAVLCRLDAMVERPEEREFTFDPVERAKDGRAQYVVAALTILRAFLAAGQPRRTRPLGSFEDWAELVRDALLWLGCADPVATMEEVRTNDPRKNELQTVMEQWQQAIGAARVSVRLVIETANKRTKDYPSELMHPDLHEALAVVAGIGGAIDSRRLGHWLRRHKDRVINGWCFRQQGLREGNMTWVLQEANRNRNSRSCKGE
jgi:hypothetical protein